MDFFSVEKSDSLFVKKKKDVRKEGVNAEFQMLLPEKVDRYEKCVPSLYFESELLLR